MKKLLLALLLSACTGPAQSQSVQQSGNVTPGHVASWITNGVVGDGGAPGGPIFTGSTTTNDFACAGASGTIIDCGLSAVGVNAWTGLQNFNGGATAPTRSAGDSTTNLATTQFVTSAVGVTSVNPPQGRLTLTSATPIMTTSVAGATTLYYTPSSGQLVPIYNGTSFAMVNTGGELSQSTADTTKSPAAIAASQVYDIFVWNDAGTIRATRGPPWATGGGSNTVRGTGAGSTALTVISGWQVNANAITNGPGALLGTYVGTVMSDGSSQLNMVFGSNAAGGGAAILGVWNAYNREPPATKVSDTNASWTFTSSTAHSADASNTNRVTFVTGGAVDAVNVVYGNSFTTAAVGGTFCLFGFALDSVTTIDRQAGLQTAGAAAQSMWGTATGGYPPQLGQHFIQAVERGDNTNSCTFIGTGSGTTIQRQGLEVFLPM